MRLTFISFVIVVLISGCAHTAKPTRSDATNFKEVKLKNYSIGTKSTVSVGESLVRVKNYTVLELMSSMQATSDFNLSGGLMDVAVNVNGRKGQKFDIVGEVEANGKYIKAIKIPGSRLVFGIYSDGKFSGIAASFSYMTSPIKGVNIYKVTPEHTRFIPAKTTHVLEDYPYENMEITYSGMSGNGIHLLYREYSIKDLIRPAFTQELIYPTDSKSIRFRKYKIKIHNVTPEIFIYTVVEE
jgi:hypothetical protein